MQNTAHRLELGMLICKHCQSVIATQDTNRVKIVHVICQKEECQAKERREC